MNFSEFADDDQAARARETESWLQDRGDSWEAFVVMQLVQRFNLGWTRRQIVAACLDLKLPEKVSLAWWSNTYPTFPYLLAARRVPYLRQDWEQDGLRIIHYVHYPRNQLKDPFYGTLLFKAYEKILEENRAESSPSGLVFQWPGATTYVLHNGSADTSRPGTRLCKTRGNECYVLEPFRQFLDMVADRWTI